MLRALHTAVIPNDAPDFAVEVIGRTSSLDIDVALITGLRRQLGRLECRMIGTWNRLIQHWCKIVANCVRQHKVPVGQTLHQRRSTQTVCSVIGEVGFARSIQTRNVGHEFVVDPQTPHGVMRCRVDTHRHVVRILTSNAFVHFEQVAVALFNNIFAKTINSITEVEVHTILQWTNTTTRVN